MADNNTTKKKARTKRTNGFQRPWSKDQVLTWLAEPALVIIFYLTVGAFTRGTELVVSVTVYTVLLVVNVFCWFMCEILDPSIPSISNCICMAEAQEEIRYCATCRKTVPGLDHHCTWLNTCIGKRTYHYFYFLAASGTFFTLFQVIVCILLVTAWKTDFALEQAQNVFGSDSAYIALIIVEACLAFGLFIAFFTLFSFHTYLVFVARKGTYAWLIHRHEKRMEQAATKQQEPESRIKKTKRMEKKKENPVDGKAQNQNEKADANGNVGLQ